MITHPCKSLTVESGGDAKFDCPVEGKGFSRVILRASGTGVYFSTENEVPSGERIAITTTSVLYRFDGGDNTVPKTLYFHNSNSSNSAAVSIQVFIEEVGSNPV